MAPGQRRQACTNSSSLAKCIRQIQGVMHKASVCCVVCRTRILYALTEEEAELRRQEYEEACSLRQAWKTLQDEADDADHDLDLPKKSFAEATKAEVRASSACHRLNPPLYPPSRVTIRNLHSISNTQRRLLNVAN